MSRVSIVPEKCVHQGGQTGTYLIRIWWDKGYQYLGKIEKRRVEYPTERWEDWVIYDRTGEILDTTPTLKEARAKAQEHFANA